ncbi:MAG: hypothetical protein NVV66_18280 [Cellulomonas sp.]|uniref:hypothetical protein n=1 Tax=Cellulomonas sp. TaxID=40001 RepID=UPI0025880C86|nr:hypothetical protein [Cellulomonas sp.]MCR6706545.1 hypothetical protein [Cellulomonas sp.]
MKSGLWLGPYGGMVELDGVQAAVPVSQARPTREVVSLAGSRFVQRARRGPREWALTFAPWGAPGLIAVLQAAAQGIVNGDVWFLDEAAARVNMLPPEFTAPRTMSSTAGSIDSLTGLPSLANVTTGQVVVMPLRGGVNYRLTGITTSTSGTTIGTTKLGAASAVNVVAPAGSGARWWSTTLAPGSATELTVTISVSTVRNLRLVQAVTGTTYADAATVWLPGQGTPCKVQVVDPERTLQQILTSGHGRQDATVTLREVGIPGVI